MHQRDTGHVNPEATTWHESTENIGMVTPRKTNRTRTGVLALGIATTILLAGCAESTEAGSTGSGEGLPPGSSMEEYQAAFEDIDPIQLNTQSPAPQGSATGAPIEKWTAAVEEWSGGKITFEIAFSNAIAGPTEIDDALNDGRLDVASTLPIYEPDEYPANAALIETGFISNQTPVLGVLQSNAWPNEVAFNTEEVMTEFEDNGMVPMIPVFNSGSQGMFCSSPKTSLSDFNGVTASASGTAQTQQISALGASPTTVAYTELFESLQRGVVECANASTTVAVLGGFTSEAPHLTISPDAGFALAPGGWTFSKSRWDELPLVAQQLMWDKLDVYIASNIEDKIYPNTGEAAKIIRENNGSVNEFGDDAADKLRAENDKLLEEVRETDAVADPDALVDGAVESADKWLTSIEELGFTGEIGYEDFDQNFDPAEYDLTEYTEMIMSEIWSVNRPE